MTLASPWTESYPSLLTSSTSLAVTVFTNCASFALSHTHSLPLLLPLPLSPLDLTIAVLFMRASQLVPWGAWTRSCILQPTLLSAYPNLVTSLDTCVTISTGSHLPWSGAACLSHLLCNWFSIAPFI